MFERRPTGLQAFGGNAGEPIARLCSIEGFGRSLIIGIIPLLALEVLGSKELVTRAYLFASLLTLTVTLNFATLERLLHRRWVISLGVACTLIAVLVFLLVDNMAVAFGIGLAAAASSLFSVSISLYIMDYVGKKELIFTESRRLLYVGVAWMIGPPLGLWLWDEVSHRAPFLLALAAGFAMLGYFWYLRLGHSQVIQPAKQPAANLLRIIPRFFSQPGLRIAYSVTLTRAIFWTSVFIYGPIYVVEADLPTWIAGGLLSIVSGLLLASPLIRRLASRYGTRFMIIVSMLLIGSSVAMLYVIGEPQPLGLVFWISASLGGVTVDVLANIPFMRLVKPRERTEMTMIYSTWRDGAQLLTPLLVSTLLLFAPFEVFYLLLAALLFGAAWAASFLPGRI
ncbi:MAG: MFS transporter [Gammaproteobacteria bacterium]|nr:MFS transporter [Gammaproteobacteria bacterium]